MNTRLVRRLAAAITAATLAVVAPADIALAHHLEPATSCATDTWSVTWTHPGDPTWGTYTGTTSDGESVVIPPGGTDTTTHSLDVGSVTVSGAFARPDGGAVDWSSGPVDQPEQCPDTTTTTTTTTTETSTTSTNTSTTLPVETTTTVTLPPTTTSVPTTSTPPSSSVTSTTTTVPATTTTLPPATTEATPPTTTTTGPSPTTPGPETPVTPPTPPTSPPTAPSTPPAVPAELPATGTAMDVAAWASIILFVGLMLCGAACWRREQP